MKTYIRRVAPGLLAATVAASCGSTEIASVTSDRIVPKISIDIQGATGTEGADSVSLRVPLQLHVDAADNATLLSVVTRVYADTALVQRDSATFAVASTSFDKVLQIPLAGVRPGQLITIRSTVTDGAGNTSSDSAFAIAFDPNVPRAGFVQPQTTVIVGGTYNFDVFVGDTTGVAKLGFRALAPGFSHADSTLFPVPYPKSDTVTYSFTLPNVVPAGSTITITPFAENRDGLRGAGGAISVRVAAAGPDLIAPIVYQTVPPRLETPDSIDISARDNDGLVRVVGFLVKDDAGRIIYRSADTLTVPSQQITRRKAFAAPIALRGRTLFITAYATDASGRTGYAVPTGATVPALDDQIAKRDQTVYAYGLTYALSAGSMGADIAVDTARATLFVSNIAKNQVEAYNYSSTLQALQPVAVGAQPWGMIIDNSNSLLLVANSGGTNISKVALDGRQEIGRVKTSNEYVYDIAYSVSDSGVYTFKTDGPFDYSDRPQYIAQSASGALYYSTRPTDEATPGTLRRLDNFLDVRSEPRQLYQYGYRAKGHIVIFNADYVHEDLSTHKILICDHTPGNLPSSQTCVSSTTVQGALDLLRLPEIGSNVEAADELDVASLALQDTNFVAVGGDRRRVAFGEGNSKTRAGRVLLLFDPSGTPASAVQYSAPIEIRDLTNNASDFVFGLAINRTSSNVGVHGAETFFADSSLRLQGKFATNSTGAGIAFHPLNSDENTADTTARVAFVASGDMSIQIVDSYSYRLRGRIPIRQNLYGPLRAVLPTAAERGADPTIVVKLFGLAAQGVVVIDVRAADIDNVTRR